MNNQTNDTKNLTAIIMNGQSTKIPTLPDPIEYMNNLFDKYGYTASALAEIIGLSRQHLCRMFSLFQEDNKPEPSRNQLIMMLIVMGATITEIQQALKNYILKELYVKDSRDYYIIIYLRDNPFNVNQIPESKKERYMLGLKRLNNLNDYLYENNVPVLVAKDK